MTQKIYLTGCTGEIGSRLTSILLKQGYEVFGIRGSKECSIKNPRHTCRVVNLLDPTESLGIHEIQPDVLVHTAWLTTPKEFWESGRNTEWVEASKRIINEFTLSGGRYLVVTGSCAEYSWNTSEPLSENSVELPTSAYGRAKLELLNWIRGTDLSFLWTRTFFQFGMNEPVGRLIPDIIDSLHCTDEFIVQSGSDVRDFVYVEDVSTILAYLISNEQTGVVNIGNGTAIEIETLTRLIAEMLNRTESLKFKKTEISKSYVVSDSAKLRSIIGNFLWTPLKMALTETIEARTR